MNATLIRALVVAVPIGLLFVYSVASARRTPRGLTILRVVGSICLLVMVFTHVAEARHWFPLMHWGEPHSVGHYVDLTSAVIGGAFLIAGYLPPLVHRLAH